MTDTPLFLHAGAHRTGTSSLQMCLHDNRAALDRAGFATAYPGRDGIASGTLALRLPGTIGKDEGKDGAATASKVARTLRDHAGARPLILSEENVPGRMFHFMKGLFYPLAQRRCAVLRAAWQGPIAHVVLVVRPYEEMFVSGFRKRAEDNAVPDFDSLRDAYMEMDRGWPALVDILRDTLRPARLSVVPYAQRGSSVALLARLVPDLGPIELREPVRVVNRSATDTALCALQEVYRTGRTLPRAQWKAVIGQHAQDRDPRGFARFSDADRAELSARYASDLMQIEGMDGVDFG